MQVNKIYDRNQNRHDQIIKRIENFMIDFEGKFEYFLMQKFNFLGKFPADNNFIMFSRLPC